MKIGDLVLHKYYQSLGFAIVLCNAKYIDRWKVMWQNGYTTHAWENELEAYNEI